MNVFTKGNTFKTIVLSLMAVMLFAVIGPDLAKANSVEDDSEEYVPIPKTIPNPYDKLIPIDESEFTEDEEYYNELAMGPVTIVATVLAIMGSAMAIGKGWYDAGYWAGKQMHLKYGLSPKLYFKKFRKYLRLKMTVIVGYIVWLGFDDYMYDKY